MRAKGIAYDTGFIYQGSVSRERFDPGVVRRELAIIRDDLPFGIGRMPGLEPSLFGFPFFYWYQFAWVPITSFLIWLVYRSRTPDETQEQGRE